MLTPALAQIKEAVGRQFASEIAVGKLVIAGGVYNCRPMRPQPATATGPAYSEHAWANAWDLYYGDRPRRYVDKVIAWLKEEDAAGRLPVGSIITYGANGNHVHIEGAPKRNPRPWRNIPPCVDSKPTPPPTPGEPAMLEQITDATWTAFYDHGHIDGKAEDMPQYYFNSTTTTKDSERWHALNIALQSMALQSAKQSPAGIGSGDQVTISGTITT